MLFSDFNHIYKESKIMFKPSNVKTQEFIFGWFSVPAIRQMRGRNIEVDKWVFLTLFFLRKRKDLEPSQKKIQLNQWHTEPAIRKNAQPKVNVHESYLSVT